MPNESHPHAGHPAEPDPAPGVGPGYEVRDTNVRAILIFVVGMVVLIVLSEIGLWGMLKGIMGDDTAPTAKNEAASQSAASQSMEAPSVLTEQLRALRASEDEALGAPASWVKTKDGKALRIPITDAIDRLAERGLPPATGPARTEVEVNSHSGTPVPIPVDPAQSKVKDQPDPDRGGKAK